MNTRRTRRIGEGSITRYTTKTGTRWRYQIWAPRDPDNPAAGHHQTGQAGFHTATDADNALTAAKQAIKQGHRPNPNRRTPTVDQWITAWIDSRNLADSTIHGYRKLHRNHIAPKLGDTRLNHLTGARISQHYKHLLDEGQRGRDGELIGKPLSSNTVQKVHDLLARALEAAIPEHLDRNPARSKIVHPPTAADIADEADEMVVWNQQQLDHFLQWNADDELHPLWRLTATTGMRRSEVLAIQWRDLDLKNRVLLVRRALNTVKRGETKTTKNRRHRAVTLDEETVKILSAYRVQRAKLSLSLTAANAPVFGNLAGETRSPNEITRRFRTRVHKAIRDLKRDLGVDLPHISLHGLRHSHITILLSAGAPLVVVKDRVGHVDVQTTMRYLHLTEADQRTHIDRILGRNA